MHCISVLKTKHSGMLSFLARFRTCHCMHNLLYDYRMRIIIAEEWGDTPVCNLSADIKPKGIKQNEVLIHLMLLMS